MRLFAPCLLYMASRPIHPFVDHLSSIALIQESTVELFFYSSMLSISTLERVARQHTG